MEFLKMLSFLNETLRGLNTLEDESLPTISDATF